MFPGDHIEIMGRDPGDHPGKVMLKMIRGVALEVDAGIETDLRFFWSGKVISDKNLVPILYQKPDKNKKDLADFA